MSDCSLIVTCNNDISADALIRQHVYENAEGCYVIRAKLLNGACFGSCYNVLDDETVIRLTATTEGMAVGDNGETAEALDYGFIPDSLLQLLLFNECYMISIHQVNEQGVCLECNDKPDYGSFIVKKGNCYAIRVVSEALGSEPDCSIGSLSLNQVLLRAARRLPDGSYAIAISGESPPEPDNVELRETFLGLPPFVTDDSGGYELREDGGLELRDE